MNENTVSLKSSTTNKTCLKALGVHQNNIGTCKKVLEPQRKNIECKVKV